MAEHIHSMAPADLPGFLAAADGSDPLFTGVVIGVIVLALILGAVFFRVHNLPDHIAEGDNATQARLVAVMVLIALLSGNEVFWVAALILALVKIPDLTTPLNAIADTLRQRPGGG